MLGPTIAERAKYANAEIGFHIGFMESLLAAPDEPVMGLAREVPSATAVEEYPWIGDLPGFEEWTQDRSMQGMARKKISIANKDWSSGVPIHRNEIADDKLGLAMDRIRGLAAKAKNHRADMLVKYLLNGFSGTAFPLLGDGLAYDGALFFATTHSFGSNRKTAALSEAALDAAEQALGELTTDDGKDPLGMSGTHLIVGKKLEAAALRLTQSGLLINAAGTAAGSNIYQGRYTVMVSPRLSGTYDDYWFLADLSKPVKPLIFQMREEITTAAQVDWASEDMFKRGQMNFGAQARYNYGFYAPQTVIGSLVA